MNTPKFLDDQQKSPDAGVNLGYQTPGAKLSLAKVKGLSADLAARLTSAAVVDDFGDQVNPLGIET